MVRTKDSLEKEDANFNYCFAKWQEFTTLTVEETENYRELVKFLTGKNILIEHQRKRPNREYKTKPTQGTARRTKQNEGGISAQIDRLLKKFEEEDKLNEIDES